ncbi:hypothetical protein RO575_07360 [Methylomonas sp. MO1]|uniref:hypothetical protein n=1 Tax=Methylomonas sp. MO1 TaxID=3073619 RepID=UPI0028A43EA8|nr:hypothetical protein [Methylomonas sp. MO1]MDT4289371.1 hypothetical protein [Methylomonas sp. MO1]
MTGSTRLVNSRSNDNTGSNPNSGNTIAETITAMTMTSIVIVIVIIKTIKEIKATKIFRAIEVVIGAIFLSLRPAIRLQPIIMDYRQ